MSKYTTEVRFICEEKAGLTESTSASKVDDVIALAWDKIFTTKVAFFDEDYRAVICKKILKHYYLREICSETVGIWQMWMNERFEILVPYYNKLYESAQIQFNPMHDTDLTRKSNRGIETNKEDNTTKNSTTTASTSTTSSTDTDTTDTITANGTTSNDNVRTDLYSDTPQGGLTGVDNQTYLTNARKVTDNLGGTTHDESSGTHKSGVDYSETYSSTVGVNETDKLVGIMNSTDDFLESLVGKQGGGSFSKYLLEYRDTLLNIDALFIDEFEDLFFGLW